MKHIKNDFLLCPVNDYAAPKYPAFSDAKSDSRLLKKIPSRWQKNMRVLSCIGILGFATITGVGCTFSLSTDGSGGGGSPGGGGDWGHHGGSGGAPIYVVYLTEQEALGIIREKGEIAGLDFSSVPPDNTAIVNRWGSDWTVGLDLFDEENGVAVSYLDNWWGRDFIAEVRDAFVRQGNDFNVGVFYNPGVREHWVMPSEEEKAISRKELEEYLTAQVKEFIEWLQAEGIIQ